MPLKKEWDLSLENRLQGLVVYPSSAPLSAEQFCVLQNLRRSPLDTNSDVQANQTASLTSPSPILWTSSIPSGTKSARCMWPEGLQNNWYHHLRRTRGDVRTQRKKEKECMCMFVCVHVCSEVLLILGEICTSATWNSRHTWSWGEQCFLELLMSTGTKPRDLPSWLGLVLRSCTKES